MKRRPIADTIFGFGGLFLFVLWISIIGKWSSSIATGLIVISFGFFLAGFLLARS